ncbi:hypothetical protein DW747_06950 [Coprococcus catus]|jgi:accessory gene regulator B|uniref:Accessory regulator AgrB n=1 Tax=Coprococcus catus TaxID=116085 RepID=A0A3E2XMA9_9FIRM|nr:accessory gene regulator B family protein [Coprococcus catus]MBX9229753.1 accessory gene regulator B family protein [Coprococcus catus]MCT6800138.1 accessory gene regulator B family protein [Coprococcus catus]RGC47900.1 hypothetical protein DW747_06950 [Coprococcus catus]
MITTISNHLIDWLIREDTLQPADRELYVYAAYCFLFAWTPLFLLFIISACIGRLPEALLLILPFMTIRKFSGGFHAKTARTCLIISCTLLSGFMYLAIHISTCLALYIVLALASISLMINSPIMSPQRPATLDEQKHFRHVVIAAMILYNSIILLLSCTGFSHWAVCLALGLILSAALQIPCIISKMKTS